jgi:hypothetical protein
MVTYTADHSKQQRVAIRHGGGSPVPGARGRAGLLNVAEVVITGRNLYRLHAGLAEHRVHWLWEFPEGRAAIGDGGAGGAVNYCAR